MTKTLKLSSPGEWRHCNGWNNGDIVRHCTLDKQVYRLKRKYTSINILSAPCLSGARMRLIFFFHFLELLCRRTRTKTEENPNVQVILLKRSIDFFPPSQWISFDIFLHLSSGCTPAHLISRGICFGASVSSLLP